MGDIHKIIRLYGLGKRKFIGDPEITIPRTSSIDRIFLFARGPDIEVISN